MADMTDDTLSDTHADLHRLTVLDALALFRTGELSPVDYLEAHLARIGALDGSAETGGINCIVDTLAESARAAARDAEDAYAAARTAGSVVAGLGGRAAAGAGITSAETEGAQWPGGPGTYKPLLGIPLLVKEQHNLAGHSATRGSQGRQGQVAPADAPIVARLVAAGAIPFARTTTPELSCATFTQTREWGITRNPFNPEFTPGGSSGGSGAAVAAGFGPLATASDIAGSTRVPAAFCGLVGFKTPYGRTPGTQPLNADWYRGDHVLARSVADAAYATNVIMGIDAHEASTTEPNPVLDYERAQAIADRRGPAPDLTGWRVAVSADLGCYAVDPAVAQNLRTVAEALAGAGASVEWVPVGLDLTEVQAASMTHYGYVLAEYMVDAVGGDERFGDLEDYAQVFVDKTRAAAGERSMFAGMALEARVQNAIADAMAGYDLLLTPTSAVQALEAGNAYLDGIERPDGHHDFYWEAHMTVPFNIANRCPVVSVPSGLGSTGVPTGVQIVGHPYRDDSVFPVAAALEHLLDWPRPPMF